MKILLSFLADTELRIHFIQNKEDISSTVNRLVTAKLPITDADLSVKVETQHNENKQNPGIYDLKFCSLLLQFFLAKVNPTVKMSLVVTSEK